MSKFFIFKEVPKWAVHALKEGRYLVMYDENSNKYEKIFTAEDLTEVPDGWPQYLIPANEQPFMGSNFCVQKGSRYSNKQVLCLGPPPEKEPCEREKYLDWLKSLNLDPQKPMEHYLRNIPNCTCGKHGRGDG